MLVLVALTLCCHTTVSAQQDEGQIVVERRDGDITIRTDGTMQFIEEWDVRFDGGPFDSLTYQIDQNFFESISDWSLSERQNENERSYQQTNTEQPGTFLITADDTKSIIEWFIEPTSNTTRHFTLRYTVHGGLRIYDSGDQLRWNFIERDRLYIMDTSRVVVHLPAMFDLAQIEPATYRYWVKQIARTEVRDGQTIEYTGDGFGPGDAWEIRATFPHGAVTATPTKWQNLLDDEQRQREEHAAQQAAERDTRNRFSIITALALVVLGIFGNVWLWNRFVRNRPSEPVAKHYADLPDAIPAGMAGAFIDERVDSAEITATIIDLAQRGYLRVIEETANDERTFVFEHGEATPNNLRTYERTLLDLIIGKSPRRSLRSLRPTFFTHFAALKEAIYDELVARGYFSANPDILRNKYRATGLAIKFASIIGAFFIAAPGTSHNAPLLFLVPLAGLPFGVGVFFLSRSMHRNTPAGALATAQWRGFETSMHHRDRSTPIEQVSDRFAAYLPYAVAFGIHEQWIDRFASVNPPAPEWYTCSTGTTHQVSDVRAGLEDFIHQVASSFERYHTT